MEPAFAGISAARIDLRRADVAVAIELDEHAGGAGHSAVAHRPAVFPAAVFAIFWMQNPMPSARLPAGTQNVEVELGRELVDRNLGCRERPPSLIAGGRGTSIAGRRRR